MKEELIGRVAQVLADLETLSEASAGRLAGSETGRPLHEGSREHDTAPKGAQSSELDRAMHDFADVCSKYERRLRGARKGRADANGQLPKMEKKELDYWLLESGRYTGMDSRQAAEDLRQPDEIVKQARRRAGLTEKYGLPPQKRGPKPKKNTGIAA
jgi:hypothetical protein